jgi:hypothetical protein
MPYETNAFTSGSGLLSSHATFLVANGWTQDANLVEGSGRRAHFSKGGHRLNFRAYENEARYASSSTSSKDGPHSWFSANYTDYMLCMNASTGTYASGETWDKQGGSGALATPTVAGGALTALAVPGGGGGAGYQQTPQVVFSGTWTTPPVAHAVLTSGAVTSYVIDDAGTGITGQLIVAVISKDHPGSIEGSNSNPSKPISVEARGNGSVLAGTYHFFAQASPDTVWIALEISAGVFRHFGFGTLDKTGAGTYTGGEWFCGPQRSNSSIIANPPMNFEARGDQNYVNCYARVSGLDGFTGWLGSVADSHATNPSATGKGLAHGMVDPTGGSEFYRKLPLYGGYSGNLNFNFVGHKYLSRSLLNTVGVELPFHFWAERSYLTDFSFLGCVGHANYQNMSEYEKAQLVTIGGNDFRVFPFNVKAATAAGGWFDGIGLLV